MVAAALLDRLPPITAPVKPKKRRGRPPKRKSSE